MSLSDREELAQPVGPDDDDDGFWVDEAAGIWFSKRDNEEVFFGPLLDGLTETGGDDVG